MKCLTLILALVVSLAEVHAVWALPARATGTLRLVVRDPSGAVIPNASVDVRPTDAALKDLPPVAVTSDGQGVATVANLPPGRYTIAVSFPGFETRTLTDVRIRSGENRRDVTLPIEKIAQSVSVAQDAAAAA